MPWCVEAPLKDRLKHSSPMQAAATGVVLAWYWQLLRIAAVLLVPPGCAGRTDFPYRGHSPSGRALLVPVATLVLQWAGSSTKSKGCQFGTKENSSPGGARSMLRGQGQEGGWKAWGLYSRVLVSD